MLQKNNWVLLTLSTILSIGLMVFPMSSLAADETEKKESIKDLETMTDKEKENYFDEETKRINNSYEINEVFSEEDEEIIRAAAEFEENNIELQWDQFWDWWDDLGNWSFNLSGEQHHPAMDMGGELRGSVSLERGQFNHNLSVTGNIISTGRTPAEESQIRVHYVDYGVIGSGGFGKTNDFWLSSGWIENDGDNSIRYDASHNFSGVTVYSTIDVYGEIQSGNGTMMIPGEIIPEPDR